MLWWVTDRENTGSRDLMEQFFPGKQCSVCTVCQGQGVTIANKKAGKMQTPFKQHHEKVVNFA